VAKLVLNMEKTKWIREKEYCKIFSQVPRITVDAVVFNKKSEVLLVKRDIPPHKGSWHLPGGMVKKGERVSQAAARKIKMETGLKIKLQKFVGLWDSPKRSKAPMVFKSGRKVITHDITLVFVGKIIGGKLRGSWQGKEVKFFKKLPKMFWEHNKEIEFARKGKFYWWNNA